MQRGGGFQTTHATSRKRGHYWDLQIIIERRIMINTSQDCGKLIFFILYIMLILIYSNNVSKLTKFDKLPYFKKL